MLMGGGMTYKLGAASLDFALAHIEARGDTDIFPIAFEFEAIRHDWANLRSVLESADLDNWPVRASRRCLAPKRSLGFRQGTQLDPLDALIATALVADLGPDIEAARLPKADGIVHSYRVDLKPDGQMFDPTYNFGSFRKRSLELAKERGGLVVLTDIADFFPRIYFHPLENALAAACSNDGAVRVMRKMLKGWNQRISHGIPVGPALCRVLAELTINDVDQALRSEGYTFCRYSDDYRIFVKDEREARRALAFLARTLVEGHGLTLQESKTEIVTSEAFQERFSRDEQDHEREQLVDTFDELIGRLGIESYEQVLYDDLDTEAKELLDSMNLWQILTDQLASQSLDLQLVRFVLHRVVQLSLQDDEDVLLSNVGRFYPVFPGLISAVAVQGISGGERVAIGQRLIELLDHPVVGHLEYHRQWVLSLFAADDRWNHRDRLVQLFNEYFDSFTRREIILALGRAKADFWFRSRKQEIVNLNPWEKRAFLASAHVLPGDEADHYFASLAPGLDPLEKAVVSWAKTL